MIMPFRSQDPEVTAQGRSSRPQLEGIAWLEKSPLDSSSLVFPSASFNSKFSLTLKSYSYFRMYLKSYLHNISLGTLNDP